MKNDGSNKEILMTSLTCSKCYGVTGQFFIVFISYQWTEKESSND